MYLECWHTFLESLIVQLKVYLFFFLIVKPLFLVLNWKVSYLKGHPVFNSAVSIGSKNLTIRGVPVMNKGAFNNFDYLTTTPSSEQLWTFCIINTPYSSDRAWTFYWPPNHLFYVVIECPLTRKKSALDILNESVFPKLGVYWFAHNDLLRYPI